MTVKELEEAVKYHDNLYWKKQDPMITDKEYDDLKQKLRFLDPENVLLFKSYTTVSGRKKVEIKKTLLSLDKVYSFEELHAWCKKVSRNENERFIIQPKYDGMSTYHINGTLFSNAGDGYGIDISDKLDLICFPSTDQSFFPLKDIPEEEMIGELVIRNTMFPVVQESIKKYKNSRNATAGIVNSKESVKVDFYPLTFVPYGLHFEEVALKDLALETIKEIEETLLDEQFDYPIDGLVIKLKDIEYGNSLGATAHHVKSSIALKLDNPMKESKLINVNWFVGKNSITPVGVIEPIEINGIEINNVSLHNFKFILDRDIHIGDILLVERAGDVIPHVVEVKAGEERKKITIFICPECDAFTVYQEPEIRCSNQDCGGKLVKKLADSIIRLGIEGIGEPTIKKMVDILEVRNINDIVTLDKDKVLLLPGFKEKSAQKLIDQINKVRDGKELEEAQLLAALNIEGIGIIIARTLLENRSIETLLKMNVEELEAQPGIGSVRAKEIYNSLQDRKTWVLLRKLQLFFKTKEHKRCNVISKGKVAITGKLDAPRKVYENLINESGFTFTNTVNKNLKYLICNESNSSSSKFKKAKTLNIKIITLEEFKGLI